MTTAFQNTKYLHSCNSHSSKIFLLTLLLIGFISCESTTTSSESKKGVINFKLSLSDKQSLTGEEDIVFKLFKNNNINQAFYTFPIDLANLSEGSAFNFEVDNDYFSDAEIRIYSKEFETEILVLSLGEVLLDKDTLKLGNFEIDLLNTPAAFTFGRIQKTIFEGQCNGCHNPEKSDGNLDMTADNWDLENKTAFYDSTYKLIVPGVPEQSYLFMTLTGENNSPLMPPEPLVPLKKSDILIIKEWIKRIEP